MFDFEEIVAAAVGKNGKPCLVQLATALGADGTTRGYAWWTARIVATVGPGWVRVRRRLGPMGDELQLMVEELQPLAVVCRDWATRRSTWAAFFSSCSGYPAGFGGAWYYQPAGKGEAPQKLGDRVMGRTTGKPFAGRDDVVLLSQSMDLASGVRIVAEVWRRDEPQGPPHGSLTGCRYDLGCGGLTVVAERTLLAVHRAGLVVYLEHGDDGLVDALLRVVNGGEQ